MKRLSVRAKASPGARKWFWITIALATRRKSDKNRPKAMAEVWLNHHLFHARSKAEALKKAHSFGTLQCGDDRHSLLLFGKPAIREYLGVSRVAELLDGVYDGCEIGWDLERRAIGGLKRRMVPKRRP